MIDWTKTFDRVLVALRDADGVLVQGDPLYYPTKLHVTVTVVAEGATFQEPPAAQP